MKCYKRYLLALFCCVSLFLVSSINVSAKSVEVPDYKVTEVIFWNYSPLCEVIYTPYDGIKTTTEDTFTYYNEKNVSVNYQTEYRIRPLKGSLIKSGETDVTISGINYAHKFTNNGGTSYSRNYDSASVTIQYVDGTITHVEDIQSNLSGDVRDFKFSFNATKDVNYIDLTIYDSISFPASPLKYHYQSGEINGDGFSCILSVDQPEESTSFLKNIIGKISELFDLIANGFEVFLEFFENMLDSLVSWLSAVKDSIVNGLANVVEWLSAVKDSIVNGLSNVVSTLIQWFTNVVNTLIELPSKLWTLIENGLKALFVPSDSFVRTYKSNFETLLEDRFGLLYMARELIIDVIVSIDSAVETKIVEMPLVNLNSVGIPFSFGGYNIQVIPDGFGFLAISCKTITSILVVIYFMNSLRRLYDEIMGVEK